MRPTLITLMLLLLCTQATAVDRRPNSASDVDYRMPGAETSIPAVAWAEVLEGLRLEFFDPATDRTYTAHGPFELLDESPNRVEVRASTRAGEDAPTVIIVQTLDGLWAVARFTEREFATRIE
jgi:hypothetical protein